MLFRSRDDYINKLLREAEANIAAGRYFDAEKNYQHALQLNPNQPLTRVGLIHAQFGAGLYRTAALNLRSLFESHPELIVVRYESNLLPGTDRLEMAKIELERILDMANRPDTAFLLAYLGYQTGDAALTAHALDLAEANTKNANDPFVLVLRRIWLEQSQTTSQQNPPTK